jgi:hypothetical protein
MSAEIGRACSSAGRPWADGLEAGVVGPPDDKVGAQGGGLATIPGGEGFGAGLEAVGDQAVDRRGVGQAIEILDDLLAAQ